jgi:membrane fusion protein, heavy metal efflux system
VPRGALASEDGRSVVYVKSANGFERREVTAGLMSDTHAAITSGLRSGEVVRLN